jgi:CheY-like chemotaxis protein
MEHGGAIDLLLTDVVMPDMSGYRLAERLQVLWPQVKVLYMSGYPNAADGGVAPSSAANFIQKPFSKERLLRRIRQALDN